MERTACRAACEILDEIEKLSRAEEKIRFKKNALIESLRHLGEEDWDWIPIKQASILLSMSDSFVYQKANEGKISSKYIGSGLRVRRSEIMEIDDKYPA